MSTVDDVAEAWTREATRLSARYQIEIVEGCGLCPWAEPARRSGVVATRVLLQRDESLDETLRAMAELATSSIDVAFLVYPRLEIGRLELDRFMSLVRTADAARHELGGIPFALASFHPDAAADVGNPERLIPFLRRTPDPTIQLTRSATLDRVRGNAPQGSSFVDVRTLRLDELRPVQPQLRERIARTNLETALRMSVAELERRLDDIRRDRDATYAALRANEPGAS